jgi:hypothetical protein
MIENDCPEEFDFIVIVQALRCAFCVVEHESNSLNEN